MAQNNNKRFKLLKSVHIILFSVIVNAVFWVGLGFFLIQKFNDSLPEEKVKCPNDWVQYKHKCVKYFNREVTFEAAEKICNLNNATMVSIHSDEENEFIRSYVKKMPSFPTKVWLGLKKDTNQVFKWIDKSPFDYSKWNYNQPDNSVGSELYVEMSINENGVWNDLSDNNLAFICQIRRDISEVKCGNDWVQNERKCVKSVSKWSPVGDRIKTKWAKDVDPAKAWPEYPRPQLERKIWVNLNGLWDYSITDIKANEPKKIDGQILVPFPVESSLSGVQKAVNDRQALWYKRHFTADVGNELLILNLDAVDYDAHVFLNGHSVGEHKGGYNRFSFDVTKFLNANQENRLVLKVTDATENGSQPIGKQRQRPNDIWYTSTTGIWQTVWLEKVPKNYITGLRITPDIDSDSVEIIVHTNGPIDHSEIQILDTYGKVVALNTTATVNSPNKLKISSPKLWSTSNPYLYVIKVKAGADSVTSYVGMRKIEFKKDSKGINRFFLNHKPIFMFAAMDQGFWPEGIYTPPNEEAMIYDLEMIKKFGFNSIRKHMKIESDRWYYATDRMGFLVWQDFPSAFGEVKVDKRLEAEAKQIELEMERMVTQLHNFPSIVTWIPFNDGWGQYETERIKNLFRKWDPSRLINEKIDGWRVRAKENEVSGWVEWRGGGLLVKEHVWDSNKTFSHYRHISNSADLQKFFIDRLANFRAYAIFSLGAASYIQTTDIEIEANGLLTYDRAVIKVKDVDEVKKHVDRLYPTESVASVIFASGHHNNDIEWHYTTERPAGNWTQMTYDSKSWSKGMAGFGRGNADITINTEWYTPDIWMRKEFELPDGKLPINPVLHIFYDDIAKVYINGIQVDNNQFDPFQMAYAANDIDPKVFKIGKNVIAIHCHNIEGDQGIDVGIIDVSYD